MDKNLIKTINRFFYPVIFFLILFFYTTSFVFAQSRSEIQLISGTPTLIIDGKSYPPFAYMSYLGEKKFYKEVAASDIHLYNIPSYLGERGINTTSGIGPFRPPIWIGENEYDFSGLIKDFDEIIASDPLAKIIIRFYLDPPLWWEKLNPESCCQLANGDTFRQCFVSDTWRKETGEALKDCLEWLLKSKYSKNLVGIHVASGFTEEWFYHPKQLENINPIRNEAFRVWLKKNYKSESAFQNAWQNYSVSFKTAAPVSLTKSNKNKGWRSSSQEQNYIDTYRFHSEVMVDNIKYFCKIVKDVSNRNLLTGAFYGYHYFVTDPKRGHGSLAKLLDCRDLDYLSSPNAYNRVIGEDWPPMAAVQSVQMHGKLWLAENDTRTSITTLLKDRSTGIAPPGQYESGVWLGPEDIKTSVALLWKNAGRMLAYGYGGWWFDMWGGWFSDPRLLDVLKKTQHFYEEYPVTNVKLMQPEVCVFVDEELSFWDGSNGGLTEKILSNRYSLGKTGTSYNLFLRTDINAVSMEQYKVIWLMGLIELSKKEKDLIEAWRKKGITVLWTNANGTWVFDKNDKKQFVDGKFNWKSSELRELWEKSGAHLYNNTDDVFYIGRNWLSVHTVDGGDRTLRFPFYAEVIDPITTQILADSTNSININLSPKSTRLLRIIPKVKK